MSYFKILEKGTYNKFFLKMSYFKILEKGTYNKIFLKNVYGICIYSWVVGTNVFLF